jgi:hypothetical protein
MGFRRAIVPANTPDGVEGITLTRVATVSQALAAVGLSGTSTD